MKFLHRIAAMSPLAAATLTPAFGQHVQTDFDHKKDFSQYKTYSWQEIKPANSLWDSRIKSAVDAQLKAKGWTPVNSGGDVAIVAVKMIKTQRRLDTFYDGFGGGWGWRRFGGFDDGFGDSTTIENYYKEGTLVIDLYDMKSKQLVWRGSAENTLSDNTSTNKKNLDKGVVKMFRMFPPDTEKH